MYNEQDAPKWYFEHDSKTGTITPTDKIIRSQVQNFGISNTHPVVY